MSGTYRLSRIGVGSAFKVGFIVGLALSALILVPFGLLALLGVVGGLDEGSMGDALALGAVSGVLTMVCGPLVYGLIYGVMSAFSALVYNMVARVVGGLEVDLEYTSSLRPLDTDEIVRNLTEFTSAATDVAGAKPKEEPSDPPSSPPSVNDVW